MTDKPYQEVWQEGFSFKIKRYGRVETHKCASQLEASQRVAAITEALTWLGTPFADCADVKGGGVDCAMLLVRVFVDAGIVEPFDPRPYPPQWHLHQDRERFLEWLEGALPVHETTDEKPGDVRVYRYGKCFSHGAIVVNSQQVLHAHYKSKLVHVSDMFETDLAKFGPVARPMKTFTCWRRPV